MATLEEKVKDIFVQQLGFDDCDVKDDSLILEDLGVDSLDEVELVMAFEEAFNIEIPDADSIEVKTVRDAIEYIRKSIGHRPGACPQCKGTGIVDQ